ncbi:MAG TPA: hypothetical protein ENI29_12685 [bacterium]|nr:hypothetical protein [bacterium]
MKAIAAIALGVVVTMIIYAIWLVSGIGGESASSSVSIAVLVPSFSAVLISLMTAAKSKKEEEIRCRQMVE